MSSLIEHAKTELALIGGQDDEMQQAINKDILEIVDVFDKQGHSGFSASYALGILKRLLDFKPLKPLTGEPDEWIEVGDGVFQNKRYSAVFKDGAGGKAYWIEGKIFSDDGGKTWFTNRDSRVYIEFPFHVPDKSEYVILSGEGQNPRQPISS